MEGLSIVSYDWFSLRTHVLTEHPVNTITKLNHLGRMLRSNTLLGRIMRWSIEPALSRIKAMNETDRATALRQLDLDRQFIARLLSSHPATKTTSHHPIENERTLKSNGTSRSGTSVLPVSPCDSGSRNTELLWFQVFLFRLRLHFVLSWYPKS